jgi:hypothetical protein
MKIIQNNNYYKYYNTNNDNHSCSIAPVPEKCNKCGNAMVNINIQNHLQLFSYNAFHGTFTVTMDAAYGPYHGT